MLDGHMRHEDSFGNRGDLGPGDVQWMTAAHGIIHSEMPQQTEGRMRGFQLWINLPAREKMKPRRVPRHSRARDSDRRAGWRRRSARHRGHVAAGRRDHVGPIRDITTSPVYLDVRLPPRGASHLPLPATHNAFVYVYEGAAEVGDDRKHCRMRAAGLLTPGDDGRLPRAQMARACSCSRARRSANRSCNTDPFVMNSARRSSRRSRIIRAAAWR